MSAGDLARRAGLLAGVVGSMAMAGGVRQVVAPQMVPPPSLSDQASQEQFEHSPSGSLFGQVRGNFADYLWMEADAMIHSGVEMRAMTASEQHSTSRWRTSQAHGQETPVARHEENETTVVPNREADQRGLLGDVEREIKPYMDMRHHHHRDPGETAALFRLMTWTNPRFIRAWVVGADVLADNLHRPADAIRFLKEGAEKNPDSVAIQVEIGRYLLVHYKDFADAERYFQRGITLGAAHSSLPSEEEDAWENAHRWLFIAYHREGRHREAQEVARTGLQRFPDLTYFRVALQRDEAAARRHS